MVELSDARKLVNELLTKANEVSKGKSIDAAGIDWKGVRSYKFIARPCRDEKEFGVTPYPYEEGNDVVAFPGGLFEHRQWPQCKNIEKH